MRHVDLVQRDQHGAAVLAVELAPGCSITRREDSGSSEAIGSSARITRAPCTMARAMAARCCWPPDSVEARWQRMLAMPTRRSASSARACSSSLKRREQAAPGRHAVQQRRPAR